MNFVKNSIWSPFLCKIGPLVRSLNVTVSILTLVTISIDRSYVILYPLKQKLGIRGCICIIMIIWIFSLLIGIYSYFSYELYLIDVSNNPNSIEYKCSFVDNLPLSLYLITIFVFQYGLPLIVFIVSYSILSYSNKVNMREMNLNMNRFSFRIIRNNRKRVIKTIFFTFYVLVIFFYLVIYQGSQNDFHFLYGFFNVLDTHSNISFTAIDSK